MTRCFPTSLSWLVFLSSFINNYLRSLNPVNSSKKTKAVAPSRYSPLLKHFFCKGLLLLKTAFLKSQLKYIYTYRKMHASYMHSLNFHELHNTHSLKQHNNSMRAARGWPTSHPPYYHYSY